MNTKRRAAALAAAVAAALTVTAVPAHADEPYSALVLYYDGWFEGYPIIRYDSDPAMSNFASDEASSVKLYGPYAWVLYDDKHYKDRHYCIRPGEKVEHLGAPQWKFNDKISSVKRLSTGSCAGYPTFY